MKTALKIFLFIIGGIVALVIIGLLTFNIYYWILNANAKSDLAEKKTLTENGVTFRDLNNNGKLDVYENPNAPVNDRVEDLLSQMTLAEKVGLQWHPPIGVSDDGSLLGKPNVARFSLASTYDLVLNRKLRTFNLFQIPHTRELAVWYNNLQKLAEQDRLGIPVSISSDPRHGVNNFLASDLLGGDFSEWPEPIGLAATNDSMLVADFGRIAAEELRSVGIRIALHPMADLATEPRWARINGTFGEDAGLASKITSAYIYGFQGDSLNSNSVACMTKHWPGGGPQKNGDDAHFRYGKDQAYPGNNFDYHLLTFEAAFRAHTAMIMPYYGIADDQTSENVGMSYNKEIIQRLLRDKYHFDGVVCTDWGIIKGFSLFGITLFEGQTWGVDSLTVKQRIAKVINAGVDQFGGNAEPELLVELVKEGTISEARIDQSARRILKAKFQLGLFDNPYVDVDHAVATVGKEEFMKKGREAQRKSIVLLKNTIKPNSSKALPLRQGLKLYVEHIDKNVAGEYGTVVDSLADADVAVLRIQTPWDPRNGNFIESFFHQGSTSFKQPERDRILKIMQAKPTIICVYMDRPPVFPGINDAAQGVLADFGAHDAAVLDIIFGKFNPTAKLPFDVPSSWESVLEQKEDVPFDASNPSYHFGDGLSYE